LLRRFSFTAAAFSGSFGGLLAAAIENLNGKNGRPDWAWIFIIEGIISFGLSSMSFFMVHDFPDTAKFLSEQAGARVIRRLKEDQQSSAEQEQFRMTYFWAAIKDYKMCVAWHVRLYGC
jgi:MFS family permease